MQARATVDASVEAMRIGRRIAGRKEAQQILSLIPDAVDHVYAQAFIEELTKVLLPPAPEPEQPKAVPIARLGATVMPFGAHNGKTLDEVPLDYLDWLCRNQEDFYRDVRAYLKHPDLESRRRGLDR